MCNRWPLLLCAFRKLTPVISVEMDSVQPFLSIEILRTELIEMYLWVEQRK
jgi:hypothetical protein